MNGTARAKKQAGILAAAVVLPALVLGSLIFILPVNRSSGAKLLEKTLFRMEQLKDYNLTIIEKGPRHELSFWGQAENGNQLKGKLPEFKLEVLYQDNRLHLKREEGPELNEADTLELQELSGFLITPLELLQSQKDCFCDAVTGEEIILGETTCRTAYFTVPDPSKLVQRLFPQVDCDGIDEVNIGVAVAESDFTLKQLRILVEFTGNKSEQIERCYYLEP